MRRLLMLLLALVLAGVSVDLVLDDTTGPADVTAQDGGEDIPPPPSPHP